MPTAAQLARQRQGQAILGQRTRGATFQDVPAPFGGWNARDSLATMQQPEAIQLDNLFPGFRRVELRRGYSSHATAVGINNVETVATYRAGSTEHLLAASSTNIYDVTSAGAGTSKKSGFSNGRWSTAMMLEKLAFVNGEDTPQEYDGTNVSDLTITGVTSSTLAGVAVFKARSYFWTGTDQSFWYSATNALGGSLTEFDLSRVFNVRGSLVNIISWTHDGGSGPDDYFVALFSGGDAVVYSGTDPGSASAWFLVGIYRIGEPIGGSRCAVRVGSDVIVITRGGYQSLASVAGTTGAARIDDRIIDAVTEQIEETGTAFGWEAFYYKDRNQVLFNYPRTTTNTAGQHVLNVATGAWCRFLNQDAFSWALFNDKPYFGGPSGVVYKADTGTSDDGAAIDFELITSWNYFGNRGLLKGVKNLVPTIATDGQIELEIEIAADFANHRSSGGRVSFASGSTGTQWDAGQWDDFQWGGLQESKSLWVLREKTGRAISTKIKGSTSTLGVAFDTIGYVYQEGGIL